MPNDDFDSIKGSLERRNETLKKSLVALTENFGGEKPPKLTDGRLFRLAAVDLFVEKAQAVLSRRARWMTWAGIATSLTAVAVLAGLTWFLMVTRNDVKPPEDKPLDVGFVSIHIVAAISLTAVVLIAVKYLIALARSFFHESVTLLSRRHALRFGRMYVYLNDGEIDPEVLVQVFDWNHGGDSSFLDIKPEEISKTPISVAAQGFGQSAKKVADKAIERVPGKPDPKPQPRSTDATVVTSQCECCGSPTTLV
ncbi:hypothetical protein [Mycobacterium sp. 155]|uniref:hypothetical protein n=1 Tax=Mycobacterium sp. 155 TaxID=1157943 RepID=UPI00036EA990|nr:hypothetical protein [Mycobacterium sp. 155]